MRTKKDDYDIDYGTAFDISQSHLPERRPLKKAKRRKTNKIPNITKKTLRVVQDRNLVKLYREMAKLDQKHRRGNR